MSTPVQNRTARVMHLRALAKTSAAPSFSRQHRSPPAPPLPQALYEPKVFVPSPSKCVIVPVAVPGCGASVLVAALSLALGAAIVNTDVGKPTAAYQGQIEELLRTHDVVVVDRNHFLKEHRAPLRHLTVDGQLPTLIALHWNLAQMSLGSIHSLCLSHLSTPLSGSASTSLGGHERRSARLWNFLQRIEPLDPQEVDVRVELRFCDSLILSLYRAVVAVCAIRGMPCPSLEAVSQALAVAPSPVADNVLVSPETIRVSVPVNDTQQPCSLEQEEDAVDSPISTSYALSAPPTQSEAKSVASLVQLLLAAQIGGSLVKSQTVETADGVSVTAWKISRTAYDDPVAYPTRIRRLWTRELSSAGSTSTASSTRTVIIARGYDKCEELGEVPTTEWSVLRKRTQGPYFVTPRLEGTLILVSALSPMHLLVTSKHAIVSQHGGRPNHAGWAERWLARQLVAAGATEAQLAYTLHKNNWTLCCELCDDEYEEHILPGPQAGLHLHGIVTRTVALDMQPPHTVAAFARRWGFVQIPFVEFNTLQHVRRFVSDCTDTGSWNGTPVKGLMILLHARAAADDCASSSSTFKFAQQMISLTFTHPYRLYETFASLTQALLRGSDLQVRVTSASSSCDLLEDEAILYQQWATEQISLDPAQFKGFKEGRGVIAARNRFYKWLRSRDGQAARLAERERMESPIINDPLAGPEQCVIMVVGPPGCGKTTMCAALAHLFNWRHIESDKVKASTFRLASSSFLGKVARSVEQNQITLVDQNCHTRQHRSVLRLTCRPARIIALDWSSSHLSTSTIQRICSTRVSRVSESLRESTDTAIDHDRRVLRYLTECEPLGDTEVDDIVRVPWDGTLDETLYDIAVDLCALLRLSTPSEDALNQALASASTYPLDKRHHALRAFAPPPSTLAVKRYALMPEFDMQTAFDLDSLDSFRDEAFLDFLSSVRDSPSSARLLFRRPCVTLVRRTEQVSDADPVWRLCEGLPRTAIFLVAFEHIVYNERIAVAVVDSLYAHDDSDAVAIGFVEALPPALATPLHCVVARRHLYVSPGEGSELVRRWDAGDEGVSSFALPERVEVLASVQGIGGSFVSNV